MSAVIQSAVAARETAVSWLLRRGFREWAWFGIVAALLLFGHLLERFGAAGVFGGYLFSLSLLGLAMPRRLMELFFFFLAMGHRDFTYTALKVGPANLYITEWVLLILLLAVAPSIPDVWRKYRPALLALGLYAGFGLLFFWLSRQHWGLGSVIRDFTIVYYGLFALAALAFLRDAGDVRRLFLAMLAGSLFNLGPDFLNYLYGTFPATPEQKNYSMRSSYYYVICAAYLLPGLLLQNRKLHLWSAAYVSLIFWVVLFYSYSKTAMAGILMVSIVSVLLMVKQLRIGALTAIIVAFMLALVITPPGKTFNFSSLFTLEFAGDDSRSMLRAAAMRDFSEYPYGIGFGSPIFGRHSRELLPEAEGFHALHNSYLTILRRMGIGGFAAFALPVALAFFGVYRVWRSRAENYDAWSTSFAACMGFAGAAVFAAAHVALEGPFFGAAFWVLLGSVFVAARGED